MLNDSINTLAATPPPAHKTWKFKTSSTASARINELEAALGLPLSERSFNLTRANEKIAALESMLAAKSAAPVVVAPVAAAPKPTAIAAPAKAAPAATIELHGREKFIASSRADLSRPAEKPNSHLTGRARFCAANHKISGQLAAPIPAPAGELTEKLTGRNRFAAAVKKDFAAIQKQK
jgi:hypothetical protein